MILTCISLVLSAPLALSQIAGGQSETLFELEGNSASSELGNAVASAGDVNADGTDDILVGAWKTRNGSLVLVGAATVLSGTDGTALYQWQGTLHDENFGIAVAAAGDVNADGFADVIIGAKKNSTGNSVNKGAAFVYSGADGSLLHAWAGGTYTNFGLGVCGAGDLNGDGFDDVLVGAPFEDYGFANSGSIFVYSGFDGSEIARWDGTYASSTLGLEMENLGDINQDGVNDFLVGAPGLGGGAPPEGWAIVISGADGSHLLEITRDVDGGYFGNEIASAGDINADGVLDYAVGCPLAKRFLFTQVGSVFVYSGADSSLLYQWNGEAGGDLFGRDLASAGDTNADGFDDLLIGVPGAPGGGVRRGEVHLYSGRDGSLLRTWVGKNDNELGSALASLADLNGDGAREMIFGSPLSSSQAFASNGSVQVVSLQTFLTAGQSELSAASGGSLDFDLNFPNTAAGYEYRILLSASGVGPTTFGVEIPLSLDNLVLASFAGNYFVPSSNMHGILNAQGRAIGSLTVPAGFALTQIGSTLQFAAIANQAGQLPEFSSVAVPVDVNP